MSQNSNVHVTAICGSLREVSYTRMALTIALRGAEEAGAFVHLINLQDYDLVFCDGSRNYPEGVHRLREDVKRSEGIILGTPDYHGSFSGVLKNALDLMGFDEFQGRVVGLVGVAGGSVGAITALAGLRTIGRALHAWVVPQEVSIPKVKEKFTREGICTDERVEERLLHIGKQVARFAYMHHSEHTQEFVRLWEDAVENPGGDQ